MVKDKVNPKISIILVNWNGLKDTVECLDSIRKIDYPNFNVIMVDNGSEDNSCSVIREEFPHVFLIENKENLGFTGGNNAALKYLLSKDTEYFFMLNNDTIVDPQILKELVSAAKAYPDTGIYGGKIYYYHCPDKIWFAGAMWDEKVNRFLYPGSGKVDDGFSYSEMKEVDYITGCALFFSREVLESVGFFDEKFFAYCEESDWCFRAKKKGFKCLYAPAVKLWHKVSASTGGDGSVLVFYYTTRNFFLLIRKNFTFFKRQKIYFSKFCDLFFPCLSKRDSASVKSLWIKRLYWDLLTLSTKPAIAKMAGFSDCIFGKFGKCERKF